MKRSKRKQNKLLFRYEKSRRGSYDLLNSTVEHKFSYSFIISSFKKNKGENKERQRERTKPKAKPKTNSYNHCCKIGVKSNFKSKEDISSRNCRALEINAPMSSKSFSKGFQPLSCLLEG